MNELFSRVDTACTRADLPYSTRVATNKRTDSYSVIKSELLAPDLSKHCVGKRRCQY